MILPMFREQISENFPHTAIGSQIALVCFLFGKARFFSTFSSDSFPSFKVHLEVDRILFPFFPHFLNSRKNLRPPFDSYPEGTLGRWWNPGTLAPPTMGATKRPPLCLQPPYHNYRRPLPIALFLDYKLQFNLRLSDFCFVGPCSLFSPL